MNQHRRNFVCSSFWWILDQQLYATWHGLRRQSTYGLVPVSLSYSPIFRRAWQFTGNLIFFEVFFLSWVAVHIMPSVVIFVVVVVVVFSPLEMTKMCRQLLSSIRKFFFPYAVLPLFRADHTFNLVAYLTKKRNALYYTYTYIHINDTMICTATYSWQKNCANNSYYSTFLLVSQQIFIVRCI